MTSISGGGGSTADAAGARFVPPVGRVGQIERTRLIGESDSGRARPVVIVLAPAGFGKSTFATQWCRSDARPVAWLSLRAADNDAIQLLTRLTHALESLEPVDADLLRILESTPAQIERLVLPRFIDGLARRSPFQLALDDVYLIDDPISLVVLKGLIGAVPARSQVVLVSRHDPPLGLARLRAAGALYEVGVDELALDQSETEQLLSVAGVHLPPEQIRELWAATEGWATGIALAAMSPRADTDAESRTLLALSRRNIADYFREEVLSTQPAAVREFLLATAIVERITGSLGEAMTGRTNSSSILRQLAATNLFVIPTDDAGEWYRYHHLFQDLLVAELRQRGNDRVTALFERAAMWHEEQGDPGEAFEYARQAGDFDRAGRVLLCQWDRYIGTGRIGTVRRWVARCEEAEIESDPQLALGAGWVRGHAGDAERANRYLAAAERAQLDRPSPDGATSLHASMVNLRGSLGTAGVHQMLADGYSLIESEGAGRTRWLLAGYRIVGFAHLVLGEPTKAIGPLNEVLVLTEGFERARLPRVFCLGLLGLCHSDLGDWHAAENHTRRAEEQLTGVEHTVERLPVLAARATIAVHLDDRSTATAALVGAHALLPTTLATPCIRAELAIRFAEAADALGDKPTANALLDIVNFACQRVGDTGSVPARADALRQRVAEIDPLVHRLTPAEQRVLRQLATHRTLKEIAEHLYISRSTVKTHVADIYAKLGVTTRADAVGALGTRGSGATHVEVTVHADTDLVLEVVDDGTGAPIEHGGGNGLRNMTQRAQQLGGRADIVGSPGDGTRLEWVVPLPA